MRKKILVIVEGNGTHNTKEYFLMTLQGEVLTSRICSNISFAKLDLLENRGEEWVNSLKERFGEFEVKTLDEIGITEEELMKRNRDFVNRGKRKLS